MGVGGGWAGMYTDAVLNGVAVGGRRDGTVTINKPRDIHALLLVDVDGERRELF